MFTTKRVLNRTHECISTRHVLVRQVSVHKKNRSFNKVNGTRPPPPSQWSPPPAPPTKKRSEHTFYVAVMFDRGRCVAALAEFQKAAGCCRSTDEQAQARLARSCRMRPKKEQKRERRGVIASMPLVRGWYTIGCRVTPTGYKYAQ